MTGGAAVVVRTAVGEAGDKVRCWCCGTQPPAEVVVRLGNHPEVVICLRCAHFLHQQARRREDASRRTPATLLRDGLRAGKRQVMRRGWHCRPVIGPVLRWLGPRLP